MSIKGISKEIFVKKDSVIILSFLGQEKYIKYQEIKRIEYFFAKLLTPGYIVFVKNTDEETRVDFTKKNNENIAKLIDSIRRNYIHINFWDVSDSRVKAEVQRSGIKIVDSYDNTLKYNARDYDGMEGHQFEYYCADLLSKNGFSNVEVTKGSGDQGIDIIAFKDGIKYGIQCKCYSSDIGNKAVQEVFSGKTFYNCHVGAVLTNRYFTVAAKELAEKNGILLWDRDYLEKMIESSSYTFDHNYKDLNKAIGEIKIEETKLNKIKYTELYKKVGIYAIRNNTYKARYIAMILQEDVKKVNDCIKAMIQNGVISMDTFEKLGKFTIVMTEREFLDSIKK